MAVGNQAAFPCKMMGNIITSSAYCIYYVSLVIHANMLRHASTTKRYINKILPVARRRANKYIKVH